MKKIKFGPGGLGGVEEAIPNLEKYKTLGIEACEIEFTYGIYIKKKEEAFRIGEAAKRLGIKLSIHAPYWINLNSVEKEKVEKSKERILACLEVGTWLGAYRVVFHPGYYGKIGKKETYSNIKKAVLEIQEIRKEKNYTPKLAPETTGKINVFGSVEEIASLVRDTKCEFTIDFAHILAREKSYRFEETLKAFESSKKIHLHFSGIEYGEKGEKKHIPTDESAIKKLLKALPKNKEIIIINESPDPVGDSIKSIKIYADGEY